MLGKSPERELFSKISIHIIYKLVIHFIGNFFRYPFLHQYRNFAKRSHIQALDFEGLKRIRNVTAASGISTFFT